jgi:tetratricopeptide (TPR) repeat protein
VLSRSVHEFPALPRFRCALAHLHAELGHEAEARALLDDLLGRDLAHEHVDAEWLFTLCLLPDPCAAVGDHPGAAKLYALLLPYGALYAQAPVEAPFGSVARGLGVLATTLGDHDAAERHFGVALEIERRMRARPWEAHARHGLATALLARDAPGDVGRARELLDAAAAGYRALGMESWAARAAPPSSGGLRRR